MLCSLTGTVPQLLSRLPWHFLGTGCGTVQGSSGLFAWLRRSDIDMVMRGANERQELYVAQVC